MSPDERFSVAVETVLRHEGGYADDAADRGGETKYGISRRQYPDVDIDNLSRPQAIEIYHRDYWRRYRLGEITNVVVAAKVLDLAVWMGPRSAATYLQTAACACGERIDIDGVIGSQTLAAVNRCDGSLLLVALRALAAEHCRRIVAADASQRRFETGWRRRALS